MATVKMTDVGTKKAMVVWLISDRKCLNCREELNFNQFQLDHITPREFYTSHNQSINHLLENLACLCKSCNSSKQDKGIEFYSADAQSFLERVQKWTKSENDIRRFIKKAFLTFDKNTVTKSAIDMQCDNYAKENASSKFARIHRNGIYWQPVN